MYEDRARKAGHVCRCGQSLEDGSSESADSQGRIATANDKLLARLGQINFEGFGDDGKELARLLEAAREESSSATALPPAPPPTFNERLAKSRKAQQHRTQLLTQQAAKEARILKAEEGLAQLRTELLELVAQVTEATRLFDLAESELRHSPQPAEPTDFDLDGQVDDSDEDDEMVQCRDFEEKAAAIRKKSAAKKLERKGNGVLKASGKTGKAKDTTPLGTAALAAAASAAQLGTQIAGKVNAELVLQGAGAPGAAPGAAGAGLASGAGPRG
jgi:hypothetical protein